jgi:hypothetical protein
MTTVSVPDSQTDTVVILYSAYIAQAYTAGLSLQRFLLLHIGDMMFFLISSKN